jgi:predicted acetyltransferase
MSTYEYGTLRDEDEISALGTLAARAFGGDIQSGREFIAANREHARVLRRGSELIGGLTLIPMGQFFGGKRVSMTGVAGVNIAPHGRGRGAATALMHAAVRELCQGGVALSTLYPATVPLYRRAGYEHAGGRYRVSVKARDIGVSDHELDMRPARDSDVRAIKAMYTDQARHRQGWLDRGDYVWERVLGKPREIDMQRFLVTSGSGPEGYIVFWQKNDPAGGYDVEVNDIMATTARAGRRLLSFLAAKRSQAVDVSWYGGPDDPLLFLLPERSCTMSLNYPWMLRITNIASALAQRGYAPDLACRLDLQIVDDVIAESSGRYVLDVAGGGAEARKGGRGSMKMHVRALAALYAGHMSPYQLAAMGMVEASPRLLARAAALFGGAAPSLPDFF